MVTRSSLALAPLTLLLLLSDWPAQAVSRDLPLPWPRLPSLDTAIQSAPALVRSGGSDRHKTATGQKPVGARKMSGDASEMFFMEYWQFDPMIDDTKAIPTWERNRLEPRSQDPDDIGEDAAHRRNASIPQLLGAPFALHTERHLTHGQLLRNFPRALSLLGERAFQCPSGTSSCSSISRPNSCCPSGESCQLISDTGQGDVGCCGQGQSCSPQVAGCQQGYSSCPGNQGGGCCIPGYACVGVGCVLSSTATVTVNPTVTASPTASTQTSSNTSSTISSSTASTSSPAVVPSASPESSSARPTSTSLPPSTSPSSTSVSSTSGQAGLPVRPTSRASVITTTTSTAGSSEPGTCPTGFYQCSAYYRGGCCRVGRDCALSNCPTAASTTVADTLGVTILAPTGNGIGAATAGLGKGSCATGWSSCAPSLGGGCCPGGYACGSGTTCTATVAGETPSVEAKLAASGTQGLLRSHYWELTLAISMFMLLF